MRCAHPLLRLAQLQPNEGLAQPLHKPEGNPTLRDWQGAGETEYLQENCPEWKERADKLRAEGGLLWTLPSDQVENEICPLMVPEVEDLLQRPVDWIGQASRSFATKSRLDVTSESPEAEPTLDPFQER